MRFVCPRHDDIAGAAGAKRGLGDLLLNDLNLTFNSELSERSRLHAPCQVRISLW